MHLLLSYLALYKRHKWILLLSIVLTAVTLLSNIGLITLSGWFLAATAIAGYAGVYSFNFMLPAVGVRSAAIIRTVSRYFERLFSHDATFCILQHIRVYFFSKLLPLFPSELTLFRHGELLNRIVADINALDQLYLRVISPLVGIFITIITMTFGLSFLNVQLAIILGGVIFFIFFSLSLLFYIICKPIGENLIRLRGEYRQQITIWLYSQAELTIFGANDRYREAIESIELNWQKMQHRQFRLIALSQMLIQCIGGIVLVSTLWVTADLILRSADPVTFIAIFVFCLMSVFESLTSTIVLFQYLGQITASAIRINEVIEQQPKVFFKHQKIENFSHVSLKLEMVSFSYRNHHQKILENISFNVPMDAHVAILGRTGCGKSTLLQLLTRTWDPQIGSIYINNIPIANFSEKTLRKNISVVPQHVHLFSATLRDNLLLAAPETNDKILHNMLEKVGLYSLVENNGLDSWLGEGGRQLSGGELRRIGIVRALLHNAPLILLDEPTDDLDTKTEVQILNLINEVTKGKTVLMVTHCLRGLTDFDQIIIMDNGKIIEQGSHKELLKKQGYYYRFKKYY